MDGSREVLGENGGLRHADAGPCEAVGSGVPLLLTPAQSLDHVRKSQSACMDAIREAVNGLAEQIGLKNQDRRWLLDDIADVLQGATADIKSEFGA